MKILIVDDDASVRESVGKVLRAEGYETVTAADGPAALKQFVMHPIGLLLLDLGLPLKNGWEVFEHITRQNPLLPIIVITGQTRQKRIAQAAGVGALMEKPLDVDELLRVIKQLLAESPEARLQRLIGRGGEVRHIPPAGTEFLQHLKEQQIKPYEFKPPERPPL
jgi:DNA-binding response OmpR family regulator